MLKPLSPSRLPPRPFPAGSIAAQRRKCTYGKCKGDGFIRFTEAGYGFVRECVCRTLLRIQRNLAASGIPEKYREFTLSSQNGRKPYTIWGPSEPEKWAQVANLKAARKLYERLSRFLKRPRGNPPGLFLHGSPGRGKTMLLCALAVDLINDGFFGIRFLDCGDLMGLITDAIAEGKPESYVLAPLMRARLLILDDCHPEEAPNPVKLRTKIGAILSHRYNDRRPTLLSSNVSGEAINRHFGNRLASRLKEYCRFHLAGGGDYRESQAEQKALEELEEADGDLCEINQNRLKMGSNGAMPAQNHTS